MEYQQCPKCGMKYHPKAGACPRCSQIEANNRKVVNAAKGAVVAAKAEYDRIGQQKSLYCPTCGSQFASAKTHTKGSFVIECFLWLLLLFPGILYSLWRLTTRRPVCPICGAEGIIPANSPRAREHLAPS
jgi:uncharacterized OB-fold protein